MRKSNVESLLSKLSGIKMESQQNYNYIHGIIPLMTCCMVDLYFGLSIFQ